MLYPLDGFLGLQPGQSSFLDQRVMLFCWADNWWLTLRHGCTPATEECLDRFTQPSSGMPKVVSQRTKEDFGEITTQLWGDGKSSKTKVIVARPFAVCPIRSPGGAT